jgi:GntR family transcriptional regulator, arabinose operon transcriptional repressor
MDPDRSGSRLFERVKRALRDRIDRGVWAEGDRIPSEPAITREFGVSRTTARRALDALQDEGYIRRARGSGSYVAPFRERPTRPDQPAWRTLAMTVAEPDVARHRKPAARGFLEGAAQAGLLAVLHAVRTEPDEELAYLREARMSGLDGIAFRPGRPTAALRGLLDALAAEGFPVVLWDRYVRDTACDIACTDHVAMARGLTAELLARGHRRVAYAAFAPSTATEEDLIAGHEEALRAREVEPAMDRMIFLDPSGTPDRLALVRLLARAERPAAVVCGSDLVCQALVEEAVGLGYRIPGDLEVASVDEHDLAARAGVPLLTAAQDGLEVGGTAAELLRMRLDNPGQPPQQRFVPPLFHFPPRNR